MELKLMLLKKNVWLPVWVRRRLQEWEILSPSDGAVQQLATHQLRDLAQQLGIRTIWIGVPLNALLLVMTAHDVFVQHRYPAIAFFIYLVSTLLSHVVAYVLLLKRRPFVALAAMVAIGELYLLINILVMREVGLFVFSLLPLLTPALVFPRRATSLILVALFAGLFMTLMIEPGLRTSEALRTLAPSMVIVIALSCSLMTISAGLHRSQYEFARLAVEREKEAAVRERAEAQRQAAEEANHRKTQFLATMNHELRAPLNSINGFAALLLNNQSQYGSLMPAQQELLKVIQDSGKHLYNLIDDILDLAKIESGKLDLTFTPVDLVPLLQGVIATTSALAIEKGLTLMLDFPSTPLPPIWGGETQLRQIMLNVVSNAVKFTKQGGVTIRAVLTEDKRMVQVAVTDTGIGIAPGDQERIWEEFQQVESDLGREYPGTGLGLPIAKKLVEAHGGQMWLDSRVGRGSTFYCTFPVVRNFVLPETAVHGPALDQLRPECRLGEMADLRAGPTSLPPESNVLIVDDDPHNRHLLRTILEAERCHVIEAPDGEHALALLPCINPALIILDLLMPHLNGFEVLTRLRDDPTYARWAQTPVLVMTAKDLTQHERGWLADNLRTIVQKQQLASSELPKLVQGYLPPKAQA